MRRVARLVAKSLSLIPSAIYFSLVVLMLAGAWSTWAFMEAQQIEARAADRLALSAQAIAEAVNAPLERFKDLTGGFRPEDLAKADRVVLTARLLRLQNVTPYAGTTFLLNAAGRLVAASAPLPMAETQVGNAIWFGAALTAPTTTLMVQRVDATWLGSGPTVVVTRAIQNRSGQPAGVVGTVVQLADLKGMIHPSWIAPSVGVRMVGTDGSPIAGFDGAPTSSSSAEEYDKWGPRLLLALGRLAGQSSELTATQTLPAAAAAIRARLDCATVFEAAWPSLRRWFWIPAGLLFLTVLASLGLCVAAWASGRKRMDRGAPLFGMDWSLDLDQDANVTAVHGYAPAQIRAGVGKRFPDFAVSEATQPGVERLTNALRASAGVEGVDLVLRDDAGEQYVYRTSISKLADGGFRVACRDVTPETRAELRAEAAEASARTEQEELASVVRDRDHILAAVGHDIRTPINSILGICTLLLDRPLEAEHRTWIKRIGASCEALIAMLNGMLEIASGSVGRSELQSEPVDVAAMVHEVADVLVPQAHDKGLDLRTRVDDLLAGSWLLDATRLRQVLFNLTSNAVKFTGHGSVEVQASVVTNAEGQASIRIAVADTGPGIALEDRKHIFERFKRGRGNAHGGLGLGLALCRENAQLMGGSLTVESSLGSGTEFVFAFPAKRPQADRDAAPFIGRTALVVSPRDAEARAICGQLERLGCGVELAHDGYIGLGMAERIAAQHSGLDIVVIDATLPGLSAEAFVTRLRSAAFGRRTAVVWVGQENGSLPVDAVVPTVETARISSVATHLLNEHPALEAVQPAARPSSGGRILVVEDDQINQSLLTACLAQRGFATFVANDGEEAVRLAGHACCDAILMDIKLPGIDGLEATRRIRKLPGRAAMVPIIAHTGLTDAVTRKRCREAGVDAFAEKPIHIQALVTVLRKEITKAGHQLDAPYPEPNQGSRSGEAATENLVDISPVFLEAMVGEIGPERTRACVDEFVAKATMRCLRLHEMLPGWETGAIRRACQEIGELAEEFGATGLADALIELSDAVARGDKSTAEAAVTRIGATVRQLGPAMRTCLQVIGVRRSGSGRQAAS